jgi:hypothetical protein
MNKLRRKSNTNDQKVKNGDRGTGREKRSRRELITRRAEKIIMGMRRKAIRRAILLPGNERLHLLASYPGGTKLVRLFINNLLLCRFVLCFV